MTDRELLELAAKAAGKTNWQSQTRWDSEGVPYWNPLTDDGDALRLAVKLGIRVEPSPRGCSVMWPGGAGLRVETILNSTIGADSATSTRRAIVRAAAEIGRAKL